MKDARTLNMSKVSISMGSAGSPLSLSLVFTLELYFCRSPSFEKRKLDSRTSHLAIRTRYLSSRIQGSWKVAGVGEMYSRSRTYFSSCDPGSRCVASSRNVGSESEGEAKREKER